LQQVTALLRPVQVLEGDYVMQAGEDGDCMYFVNSGAVQVLVDGREVDRLTAGDFFGEVALTVAKKRTADVVSLGNAAGHSKFKRGESVELFQLTRYTGVQAVFDEGGLRDWEWGCKADVRRD
jgi:hypothetical protein